MLRRPRPLQAAALALGLLGLAGCGGGTPAAPSYAGPTPVARHPVLAACPAPGRASRLPRARLTCFTGGSVIDTTALGGRPTLVNLWASWCGPCQREMPALQRAYQHYQAKVSFLGVDTTDERASAEDFLATIGIHYPQVSDTRGDLLHRVGGPGLPVTLVLDANGAVVYSHRGQLKPADLTAALGAAGVVNPSTDAGMTGEHHAG